MKLRNSKKENAEGSGIFVGSGKKKRSFIIFLGSCSLAMSVFFIWKSATHKSEPIVEKKPAYCSNEIATQDLEYVASLLYSNEAVKKEEMHIVMDDIENTEGFITSSNCAYIATYYYASNVNYVLAKENFNRLKQFQKEDKSPNPALAPVGMDKLAELIAFAKTYTESVQKSGFEIRPESAEPQGATE